MSLDVRFRRPSGGEPMVFGAARGETVGVLGGMGTGKSRLLRKIIGVDPARDSADAITLDNHDPQSWSPRERAQATALVPTDAHLFFSLIVPTVAREVAVSLEFLGRRAADDDVNLLLQRLGIDRLRERNPVDLSGGEKVKVAIAASLVREPRLLLLDDVYRELDPDSELLLRSVIAEDQCRTGMIVVETHSRERGSLSQRVSRVVRIDGDDWPDNLGGETAVSFIHRAPDAAAARVTSAVARYASSEFQLGPIDLKFASGTITALTGPNGAGKTTLLRLIGGLVSPVSGAISLGLLPDTRALALHRIARHAQYSFQNPDHQIYLPTVRSELAETATRIGTFDVARFAAVAKALALEELFAASPLSLPRPLRRLITIGSAFIASPPLLLLDEPTAGLDSPQIAAIEQLLRSFAAAGGTTILVSHDLDFARHISDRRITLIDGRVERDDYGFSAGGS